MKKIIFLFVINLLIINVFAQDNRAIISFDKMSHDFGSVAEDGGIVLYTFEFTNSGGEPLIITTVSASCGCTTPDYTKEPVAPGKKGMISVAFNPRNRPGTFEKSLNVISNAANSTEMLTIKGEVTAKTKTIEDEYPNVYGDLRFDKVFVNYANTFNDETKTEVLKFINTGKEKIDISLTNSQLPSYITVEINPISVLPEGKGEIKVTIDGSKVEDWDYISTLFYLVYNGTINTTNRIYVTAILTERFSEEAKANPPTIEFEKTEYDFGTVTDGDKIEFSFDFKNTGKADLLIRKTRASCGCTAVTVSSEPIKPGKKNSIKAVFDTSGKSGKQSKIITVITNDPNTPKIILKMSGEVKAK